MKIIIKLLKIPLILLVVILFISGIYSIYNKIEGITIITPIIFGGVLVLYFIAGYLDYLNKKQKNEK